MARGTRRTAQEATTPVPLPVMEAGYVTTEYLESLGLDPTTASAALSDAAVVRELVAKQQGVDHAVLVKALVESWGDGAVDRLNAALGLLARMGLIHQVN